MILDSAFTTVAFLESLTNQVLVGVIGLILLTLIVMRISKAIRRRNAAKADELEAMQAMERARQQAHAESGALPVVADAGTRAASSTASRRIAQGEEELTAGQLTNRTDDLVFGAITPTLAALLPESEKRKENSKKELINAGYYEPHAWENFAAIRYVGIILPIILCGVGIAFGPPQLEPIFFIMMIVLPMLGWSIPRLLVKNKAKTRLSEIEHSLPDFLDLLNMCVSQGLPLQDSLKRIGLEFEEVYPALSKELKIVTEQAEIGNLEQGLLNFNKRVESNEVHSLTSLLIQTQRMGTSVSDALAEYSDGMRETLRQRADQKANNASFQLLFPTVLCLMPAVYLFLLGPAIVELGDFFTNTSQVLDANTDNATQVLTRE